MGSPATAVRSILAAAAGAVALALTIAWAVGRIFTDRFVWSQWMYWVPVVATVGGAGVLLLGARLVRPPGERSLWARVRSASWIGLAVVVVWTGVVEWRGWRWPARWFGGEAGGSLRVVAWNPAMMPCPRGGRGVIDLRPDVLVINNQTSDFAWADLRSSMGGTPFEATAPGFVVVSRWPILRRGGTELGLKGLIFGYDTVDYTPEVAERTDPGRAAYFEIDTREALGRTIVLWTVDLPSDPLLGRVQMMRQARAAIDGWRGTEYQRVDDAWTMAEGRFPPPDLIVGDFNTPRGSASLKELVGDLASAYSQAGVGMDGTWPRMLPLFHIDQMFVGSGLSTHGYWVVDPGEAMHRAQVGEFVRAGG